MNRNETEYLNYLEDILKNGIVKEDRTGTGTRSLFGKQMRFDLTESFPLLTTKRVHFRGIAEELFWFLRGETNVKSLQEKGITIWDEWADAQGELGPIYGKQWRSWKTSDGAIVDQIQDVIDTLRHNPDSRRMVVSAWNVGEINQMALPPCHMMFQFWTRELSLNERKSHYYIQKLVMKMVSSHLAKKWIEITHEDLDSISIPRRALSCQIYQRSCDSFLGVPYNIASYALLTHLIAEMVGMVVQELVWVGGDCHIYSNHIEQVREQLSRRARRGPQLNILTTRDRIEDYTYDDLMLVDYDPHPAISAPVAV